MIGIVLVTHGNLGEELLKSAQKISLKQLNVKIVPIDNSEEPSFLRQKVKNAIKMADRGCGVIVLTDLFGGTPSNICISLMDETSIEMVSGVNLPMLLKIIEISVKEDLKEAAIFLKKYGRENISIASDLLNSFKK